MAMARELDLAWDKHLKSPFAGYPICHYQNGLMVRHPPMNAVDVLEVKAVLTRICNNDENPRQLRNVFIEDNVDNGFDMSVIPTVTYPIPDDSSMELTVPYTILFINGSFHIGFENHEDFLEWRLSE